MNKKIFCSIALLFSLHIIGVAASQAPQTGIFQGERNILIGLSTDKTCYMVGEPIHIWLEIRNPTDTPIHLGFVSGYSIDYEILWNTKALYQRHGAATQTTWTLTILPHDSVTYHFTHFPGDYPLTIGQYLLHSWIVGYGDAYLPLTIHPNHLYYIFFLDPGIYLTTLIVLSILVLSRRRK